MRMGEGDSEYGRGVCVVQFTHTQGQGAGNESCTSADVHNLHVLQTTQVTHNTTHATYHSQKIFIVHRSDIITDSLRVCALEQAH